MTLLTASPPASAAEKGGEIAGYRSLVEAEAARVPSAEVVHDVSSRDEALAARAALALGRTKDARAQSPLASAVRHSRSAAVRAMSMYGLGLLADKVTIDLTLVAASMTDPSGAVRVAALDAAQRAVAAKRPGADALAAPVLTVMRADRDPIVRGRAAVTLAAFADTPVAVTVGPAVVRAYEAERDRTVRWHQAWTLGRAFPKVPARAQIVAGFNERDELARMEWLVVAGRHGDPSLAKELESLTRDPSWRIAEQAYESIKRLAGGSRTEHLAMIPEGVATPPPPPEEPVAAVTRPPSPGPVRKPVPSDARLDLPLRPLASAAMDGPAPGPHPRVRIGTTKGAIVVRLYPEWAPLTVANFLNLVNRGYYDNLRWFRIVPNFVAQTGDPHNDGEGDAGYTIPAEENPLEQRPGIIAMGLNYEKGEAVRDSAGTQFYITMSPQLHLNRSFTVFGEVESGFNVLGRLIEADTMTRVEQIADD